MAQLEIQQPEPNGLDSPEHLLETFRADVAQGRSVTFLTSKYLLPDLKRFAAAFGIGRRSLVKKAELLDLLLEAIAAVAPAAAHAAAPAATAALAAAAHAANVVASAAAALSSHLSLARMQWQSSPYRSLLNLR